MAERIVFGCDCAPRSPVRESGSFHTHAGVIDGDGRLSLQPSFHVDRRWKPQWSGEGIDLETDALLLDSFDANGVRLQQQLIPLQPVCTDRAPSAFRIFSEALTWNPLTAQLHYRMGGQVLLNMRRPVESPQVRLTWMLKDLRIQRESIHWEASLHRKHGGCAVLYSHDGGANWRGISPPLSADVRSFPIDFASLPGGVGVVRVMVTDGFTTAVADSAAFRVPQKGIELSILTPRDRARLRGGELIWFRGQAFHHERDSGADTRVRWVSSQDGVLGEGAVVSAVLSHGEHTIELSAAEKSGIRPKRISVLVGEIDSGGAGLRTA